jgi:hypothetical protein
MRAFLDESGTHAGSRVIAVAGYVISSEALPLLEEQWLAILEKHSIDELHMREFVPPHGKYSGWSEKEKRAVLEPLIGLIHSYSLVGVGAAVEMTEFMKTTQAQAFSKSPALVETPHQWCLRYCMVQAARWADETENAGLVSYTLDKGCLHRGRIQRHFNLTTEDENLRQKYRVGPLDFADSKTVPAIQCADLLAYEMYKEADRLLSGSQRSTRGSFLALFRGSDRLTTIDPEPIRRQVSRGIQIQLAMLNYLPHPERFQVTCHALRAMKKENREVLFQMFPPMRNVFAACIAKGEMGKPFDELPGELRPSDEYILSKIDEFRDLSEEP